MTITEKWDEVLSAEYEKPYFKTLNIAIDREYAHYKVYPPRECVYAALKLVDYDKVRVVILGQDPYHGENQANGLAFAVNNGVEAPPSLVNIFKEIKTDIGIEPDDDTTLVGWANQGVLLLNAALTVRAGSPQSHAEIGWHNFTDAVIRSLNAREKPVAYILWGMSARQKTELIDKRNFIHTSAHPSPLSAYRGFFGSKPFSKVNAWLSENGMAPVHWHMTGAFEPAEYYKTADRIKRV
ncbi:MAG: uracil-DNA glycosylase [Clostridia bacterium]|nr:uracil-DNA glycosylase [Clostridia bacterium]MCX4314453.1 uracil-DNA glycosylase [Clostridia bacterium]